MDPFDSDNPFGSGNYPDYRSTSPSQRSIDDLFDQAQRALNELSIPESNPLSNNEDSSSDNYPNCPNCPNTIPKNAPPAADGGANIPLSGAIPQTDNPERMYTLKEILESLPSNGERAINWKSLEDIELDVSVVLGDTEMTMENVMQLKNGAVVPLNAQKDDPVTLVINGQPIAKGEVMTRNGKFCIRITEIFSDQF